MLILTRRPLERVLFNNAATGERLATLTLVEHTKESAEFYIDYGDGTHDKVTLSLNECNTIYHHTDAPICTFLPRALHNPSQARLGFDSPKSVNILREELELRAAA